MRSLFQVAWVVGMLGALVACSGGDPGGGVDAGSRTPAPGKGDSATTGTGGGDAAGTGTGTGTGSGTGAGTGSGTEGQVEDGRAYTLEKINGYRTPRGLTPMRLDDALNTFAQAASTQLSLDHDAHAYFNKNAGSCGCGLESENQGAPEGWAPAPAHTQIDQILQAMVKEGPGGGHYDNIFSKDYKRIGVGIVTVGGAMFFTNGFAP